MRETIPTTPGFSFRRVWAFALYYMPRLQGEMLIYAGISLIAFILCLLPGPGEVQKFLMVGVWTVIPILFYCGALIFAKGSDTRIIERLMPVSAAEKLTFYYIYILIVIPIVVYLLPVAASWIYMACPSLQTPEVTELYKIRFQYRSVIWVINLISGVFVAMACLYGVMASRHNRMMFGIVGVVVANVAMGILSGIIGVVSAIKAIKENAFVAGLKDGLNGAENNAEKFATQFVTEMLDDFNQPNPLTLSIMGVIIVLIILTGWLTYRSIKRKNL